MAKNAAEPKKPQYNNQSITMLKGADRVRKAPERDFRLGWA